MVNLNEIFQYKIILASKSPRRLQLIKQMGFEVGVRTINVEEVYPKEIPYNNIAEYLAKKKAEGFNISNIKEKEILLTADTIVFINNKPIGKPKDREEAISFLQSLSEKEHKVITGCCLKTKYKTSTFSVCTNVFFKKISQEEIEYYIDKYQPYDKAGAYGIQEWIGSIGIEKIEGCFYNVMGLPTTELFKQIKEIISNQ